MAASLRITEQDAGRTISIHPGDRMQIILDANPSTGYTWEAITADTKILKQGDTDFFPNTNALGASGKMILRFEAIALGVTSLTLVNRRPFEGDVPARKSFEIIIRIE